MLDTCNFTSYSDADSIKLETLLIRITKEIKDELARRTRAKMKILQEDIDSMTKEGILNNEASITLAMITSRVSLMFVISPFSGFGVGVDAICILYVIYQLYRIASSEK